MENVRGKRIDVPLRGHRLFLKRAVLVAIPMLVVVALLGDEYEVRSVPFLRRLALDCIHNIYATPDQALNMPAPPTHDASQVPSYIALCYEWVKRENDPVAQSVELLIKENKNVCLDWTAPHYSMLEILSSSIIGSFLPNVKYRHHCEDHRTHDEAILGFDRTTIQQVFQTPALTPDLDLISRDYYNQQCKICLEAYEADPEAHRILSHATHHCFAYPINWSLSSPSPTSLQETSTDMVISLPSEPINNLIPLSGVVPRLIGRLTAAAMDWEDVTDAPTDEKNSGVVILLDQGSLAIPPEKFAEYIPEGTTSISVLAGPLCVTAYLPTGEKCMDYGGNLANGLGSLFPEMDPPTFQIPGPTAGVNSRAALAKDLICPPATISCFLPALGKPGVGSPNPTQATIFESPDRPKAVDFFDKMGTHDKVTVIQLGTGEIEPIVEGTEDAPVPDVPTETTDGRPLSSAFEDANVPVDSEGYTEEAPLIEPPPPPEEINQTPSTQIQEDIEEELPEVITNPNVQEVSTENQVEPDSQYPEIGSDETLGLDQEALDYPTYIEQTIESQESTARLTESRTTEKIETSKEIPCPTVDATGQQVTIDGGTVITDHGDTVTVSSGDDTVVFKGDVEIETVPVERATDPITEEEFLYVTVQDPVNGEYVNITGKDIANDPVTGEIVITPVGKCIKNPLNGWAKLITRGTTGSLGDTAAEDSQTIITGEIESTGTGDIPVDDVGTVVRKGKGFGLKGLFHRNNNKFEGFSSSDSSDNSDEIRLTPSTCEGAVTETNIDNCKLPMGSYLNPIYIRHQTTDSVTFDVYQTWKGLDSISWVAVDYIGYSGGNECLKTNEVPFGNFKPTYTARCTGGVTTVNVYIHDGSKKIGQADGSDITASIPARCKPSKDYGKKCAFQFELNCSGGCSVRRQLAEVQPVATVKKMPGPKFLFGGGKGLIEVTEMKFGAEKKCAQAKSLQLAATQ